MIFIIGIDHLVQYNGPVPETLRLEFRDYLVRTCRDRSVRLLAEEFNEEALVDLSHATAETARDAATMLGIEHRYCDPVESDLVRMGIPYYAEVMDLVKTAHGIATPFIVDDDLRARVKGETERVVRSYWPLREQFWYDRLRDRLDRNILFLCGHEHAERFHLLLHEKGRPSHLINRFWKKEIFSNYDALGIK